MLVTPVRTLSFKEDGLSTISRQNTSSSVNIDRYLEPAYICTQIAKDSLADATENVVKATKSANAKKDLALAEYKNAIRLGHRSQAKKYEKIAKQQRTIIKILKTPVLSETGGLIELRLKNAETEKNIAEREFNHAIDCDTPQHSKRFKEAFAKKQAALDYFSNPEIQEQMQAEALQKRLLQARNCVASTQASLEELEKLAGHKYQPEVAAKPQQNTTQNVTTDTFIKEEPKPTSTPPSENSAKTEVQEAKNWFTKLSTPAKAGLIAGTILVIGIIVKLISDNSKNKE